MLYLNTNFKDDNRFSNLYNKLYDLIFSKINAYIIVAGGYVRKEMANETWLESDIDLFFNSEKDCETTKTYFNASGARVIRKNKYVIDYDYKGHKISIIYGMQCYSDMRELLGTFDFTVCCCAIDSSGAICMHKDFFADISTRSLKLNNRYNSQNLLNRLQKYIIKGYLASNESLKEISSLIVNSYSLSDHDNPDYNQDDEEIPQEDTTEPNPVVNNESLPAFTIEELTQRIRDLNHTVLRI